MSALSTILHPTVEPPSKQEDDDFEVRYAKRRELTPPSSNNKSSTPEGLLAGKDERRKKWLAGLSHEELLGVANGAVWQVGGLHSKNCFTCKKGGVLLECHNCPRSYHRRCLDPPIHGNFKIDGLWLCPNCVLLQLDSDELSPKLPSWQGRAGPKFPNLHIGDVTPLHHSLEPATTKYANPTPGVTSRNRTPLPVPEAHDRPHKRSRYATLPEPVDEALGLLNRELGAAYQTKGYLRDMAAKIHVLEQELRIRKGQEVLRVTEQEKEGSPGKEVLEELEGLKKEVEGLREEKWRLKEEVNGLKREAERKEREMEEWRSSLRGLVDGR